MNEPDTVLLDTLVAWMREGGFQKLSYSKGTTTISLTLAGAGPAAVSRPLETIVSSGMGRFTLKHPIAAAPYVELGTTIAAGDIMALLAIGPVLTAVEASRAGIIRRILVEEGALVGFEDPLFEIEPVEG